MAENFPNLRKEVYIQIQEAQRVPKKNLRDPHGDTLYLSCQKLKTKKILKAVRKKQLITYKRTW